MKCDKLYAVMQQRETKRFAKSQSAIISLLTICRVGICKIFLTSQVI
jgi:hypothetical protein